MIKFKMKKKSLIQTNEQLEKRLKDYDSINQSFERILFNV